MLLPDNKVPAWGAAYSLASELSGISKDHPPSAFVQNLDDTTAPPQGTLAYAQKLLALGAPKPVIHMCAPSSAGADPTPLTLMLRFGPQVQQGRARVRAVPDVSVLA